MKNIKYKKYKLNIILLICLIILFTGLGKKTYEFMTNSKINTEIVISINIYKNIEFFKNQIENISHHVKSPYIIILNCDNTDNICDEIINLILSESLNKNKNIYMNPIYIKKERFFGSITNGIYSNMKYASEHFNFKYFLILSSRTFFYKDLTIDNLNELDKLLPTGDIKNKYNIDNIKSHAIIDCINKKNHNYTEWWWPIFMTTLLGKYYLDKGYNLHGGAHEGLCFNNGVTNKIISFLDNNEDIKNNLFNNNSCVEEFSLQTIAFNEIGDNDLNYGYIYIGNGIGNDFDMNNPNLYTKKIDFL